MVLRAENNPFPSVLFEEHVDPANPDAGTQRLFVDTDHVLKLIDSSGTVTTFSGGVTDHGALTGLSDDDHTQYVLRSILTTDGDLFTRTAGAVARLGVGSDGDVLTVASGAPSWAAPTGGGTTDPIVDQFGAATTTYDGTSLSGWTAFGSPDVNDADTTVQDAFYLKDTNGTFTLAGNYRASPSTPFTLIAHVTAIVRLDYHQVGLFVGAATPGFISSYAIRHEGGTVIRGPKRYRASSNTDGSGSGGGVSSEVAHIGPCYLAIVVTSTSSVAYYMSQDGYAWFKSESGHDPSGTIGSIGFFVSSGGESSVGAAGIFRTIYVYGSALTMPGA